MLCTLLENINMRNLLNYGCNVIQFCLNINDVISKCDTVKLSQHIQFYHLVLKTYISSFYNCFMKFLFITVVELVAPSKRVIVSNTTFIFFAIGYYLIAGIAYLIPNWRIVQLVISLPYIPVLILAL